MATGETTGIPGRHGAERGIGDKAAVALPTRTAPMPTRRALACLALLAALATPTAARELGRAPELRILGFSADGRHFGFEQEGGDGVNEKGAFAVDVVDATTGRSARGFPRGVTQVAWDSEAADPRRAAMRGFRFSEDDEASATTAAVRRWTRGVTQRPLRALRLTDPGRRLGGQALTDLTETSGPVRVMGEPDIIGAHPGTAMKYTVTAQMPVPEDPDLACRERATGEAHTLTVTLKPEVPSWDPEAATRAPKAFREQSAALPFILPPKTCFHQARVTDVYRSENGRSIAVVVAVTFDVGFTDSAEYHATIFALGED